ncbi:hypothetical protein V5O48_006769 [Marasmius crinis-equi]|uniref:Heme haloperoxidase family profile domain-containing protein n=1 Tax=Marasmius crinis-equi TaxID=585013 RepID=A0ABR3FIK7_9AGAR
MKFQQFLATLALLSSTAVIASVVPKADSDDPHDQVDWEQHQFQAPTEDDARGPCPGLNTLANHGFLPRNGKNITIPVVLKAGLGKSDAMEFFPSTPTDNLSPLEGFNVHRELLLTAAKAGVMASDLDDQFSLTDIGLHGNIEHDASVSRVDHALGNNLVFNETIFTTLANSNPGVDYYNATSAGQVQKARLEQSKADNPKFRNTIKEFQIRNRESALYLSVMGDPTTGMAPKEYVNIFFREERMPLEEGWRISKVPIDHNTDGPTFQAISKASEWEATPDQCPWVTLAQGAPEDPINDGSIL